MNFHIAEKGKQKGMAVYCGATIQCTLMREDEHMSFDEAREFNKEFAKVLEQKNIKEFGMTSSLNKHDFSQSIDLFDNLNTDNAIATKQRKSARKIIQSDRAIRVESDKIFWKNLEEELDISEYDSEMQNITLDRFHQALESEAEITSSLMSSIKGMKGVELDGLAFRLKSPASLARKIEKKSREKLLGVKDPEITKTVRNNVANSLQDVVRYTFVVENHDKIGDLVAINSKEMIRQGYRVIEAEHSYVEGNSYMDAKIIWQHPETGESFEVQYHSKSSMMAKNTSHEIYEKLRVTEDSQEKKKLAEESSQIWSNMKIPSSLTGISERTGIDFERKIRQ